MRLAHERRSAPTVRRVVIGLLLLLGLVLAPTGARAEPEPVASTNPMLWLSKGEPRIWVFGTLDVPAPRAQAVSPAVERALGEIDAYFTELPAADTDLARLEAQAKRLSALAPEVGGLRKLLGDPLHARVAAFVTPGGMSTLESREPWYVRRLMVQGYLQAAFPHGPKLLSHDLWDRSHLEGVQTAGLDTAPEYVEIFDALTLDEQVAWLSLTVERCEKDKKAEVKHHAQVVQAYLAGDTAKLQALWRETLPGGKLGEKLVRGLLDDRVRRMLGRLASRLKRNPDEIAFLACDASLLAGEKGVLKQLAAQGHDLRRVTK